MKNIFISLIISVLILCFIHVSVIAGSAGKKYEKHTVSPGLVMAGYQGWFATPEDGADIKWYHYDQRKGLFQPGSCPVDLWPDMTEYEKQYQTAFRFEDGSPATVYSAHDESSVTLHFKWMQEYDIDGVFMQRFVNELKKEKIREHINTVLTSASKAASQYDRTIAVMYDLSGMKSADTTLMMQDWTNLLKTYGYSDRQKYANYLFHEKKPVVAIWGVGFNDRRGYSLEDIEKLIKFFKSDKGGHCAVLLGVPTYWREQGNDCIKDEKLHTVIKMADIVHPWFVGRFNEEKYESFKPLIGEDKKWCDKNGIKYMPVVFPGFSWDNLFPDGGRSLIPRNQGEFFWKQLSGAINEGAEMIYVAMFDEIDEGTAIFKIASRVPVCEGSKFVPLDPGIPSDHYLWLAGKAGQILKNKQKAPFEKPVQYK